MIYVLTRTANRPKMFAQVRANLQETGVEHLHFVHSDDPQDDYVDGDVVIEGERLQATQRSFYGPELYIGRLLQAVHAHGVPGWVVVLDDDDVFLPGALRRIQAITESSSPDLLHVWKVRREAGRINPQSWRSPLASAAGKLCWESATFHTSHIPWAVPLIPAVDGGDGEFWAALAKQLKVQWHDFIATEPQREGQAGKGRGLRADGPGITVAVPILGRPKRIYRVSQVFSDPRVEVLFLPDDADKESMAELEQRKLPFSIAPPAEKWGCPTYASKVNHAYEVTATPFLLYASDDVTPRGDWVGLALDQLQDETVGLLATNDKMHKLVRAGKLATHGIVRRAYVEQYGSASLPDSGPIFHEGYRHWCCDVEVSHVAHGRGAFRFAPDVVLAHDRVRRKDKTYQLGQSYAERDKALARERVPGWEAA